jgi:ankyrin repeat protein
MPGRAAVMLLCAILVAPAEGSALPVQADTEKPAMTKSEETVRAAVGGDVTTLRALLAADPSLADARDERGVSAILRAIFAGQREAAELLASRRASITVIEAAALGREAQVERLLATSPGEARAFGPDGFTALHYAAHLGYLRAARALVEAGADVNARSRNGLAVTPLQSALPRAEVVRFLLERGADARTAQENGSTALHAAAASGAVEAVELLLAAGADPRARQASDGKTPLDLATERGHAAVAKLLRERER